MKDTPVIDFGAWVGTVEPLLLLADQAATNFDDVVARPLVHHWIIFLKVVQNIHGQCSVPCTNFINGEILVWEILEEIFRH